MAVKNSHFRRLLLTFGALSDLSTELTADRHFGETAGIMLTSVREALGVREAALFTYSDKPSLLALLAAQGFVLPADRGVIPLLPKHVHALSTMRGPALLTSESLNAFLSSNGNLAPELFKCIAPLRVRGKLVGMLGLGHREDDAMYESEELESLSMLSNYVALAVHNHALTQTLEQRVSENLRLLGSLHKFYDNALEAFAAAIDVKHVNLHGHSLRVGRYSAGIAEALGHPASEVAGLKAAGYLHDIGKVAVDKRLFGKPSALDAEEFREVADHTVVGYKIVTGIEFPWRHVAEVVRSHHERNDATGYPDRLPGDGIPEPARIVAVADSFDAMVSERPYREALSVGAALAEIVKLTPAKFDPGAVHALLVQVRRDAVGSNKSAFLDESAVCNIGATDVDQLASVLQYKMNKGRIYSA